ncbi:Fic family protein [Bifidobacterium sp. ESL0790]|uniref:Fic family protein n=1 Tax=Bifidobacterium sp. ESL0790 TaxID=2983233 RepID=UPI0023FA14AB|nr:Fic family protein [Bifidobacterium sp. ESL0790]WEV72919.1 Fic family protein [Bifidobacterium sp. ESL0790]
MTPAERASAVAFTYKNCELSGLRPSQTMVAATNHYQRGELDVETLLDVAELGVRQISKAEAERAESQTQASSSSSLSSPSSSSQLLADRVFARSIRAVELGWLEDGSLDELKSIHRRIFVGAMPGAGELRSRDEAGTPYFPAALIETGAANIITSMAERRRRITASRTAFIEGLAGFADELTALRPFDYGNDMVLRIFISRFAHTNGWDLDWGPVRRNDYLRAKHLSLRADTSGYHRLFDTIARPANLTRVFLISGWDQGPAH